MRVRHEAFVAIHGDSLESTYKAVEKAYLDGKIPKDAIVGDIKMINDAKVFSRMTLAVTFKWNTDE